MEAEVVHNEEIGSQERAEGLFQRVVDPGLGERPEEVVGTGEADAVAGADGSVAEGLGEEGLPHAHGADEEDVLVAGEEVQGKGGVEKATVQGDLGGPVEVLEWSAGTACSRWRSL